MPGRVRGIPPLSRAAVHRPGSAPDPTTGRARAAEGSRPDGREPSEPRNYRGAPRAEGRICTSSRLTNITR
ncbi:hypothetical protein GCM10017556_31850 [Micromonospora sagamiensis]|nr:hypothetical protein GCM10017556_31850 [Micromonospora sagamiensis]